MAKGKKTGGRKPGSINKITKDLRVSINDFLVQNFDVVIKEWNKIDKPTERLNFYKDLLKFAVPSLQATKLDDNDIKQSSESILEIIHKKIKNQRRS